MGNSIRLLTVDKRDVTVPQKLALKLIKAGGKFLNGVPCKAYLKQREVFKRINLIKTKQKQKRDETLKSKLQRRERRGDRTRGVEGRTIQE